MVIILTGIGGAINNRIRDEETRTQTDRLRGQIDGLRESVETAYKSQQDTTKQFLEAFNEASQKLSNLQTQVRTAGLQKEADRLKAELEATRKALIPPKAALTFTFERPRADDPILRTVTLPVKNDVVHAQFTVRNDTDVAALNGELTLIICDACKFAAEPPLFAKLPGQPDTQRNYKFDRLLPKTELRTLSADIKVPPNTSAVELTVSYRCVNCIVPEPKANTGIILLSR